MLQYVMLCNVTLLSWLHLLTEGIDVGVLYCCLNWGWRQQQGIGGLTSDSLFGGDMGVTNPSNKQGGLHQSWQWSLVILQLLWSRSSKPHAFIWRFIHAGALKRPHISSYFHTKPIFMLRTDESFWAGNAVTLMGGSESITQYHPELFQSISISHIPTLSRLWGCDNGITDITAGLFMHSVSRIKSQVAMEESPQRFSNGGSKTFKNCWYQLQTVLLTD